MSKQTWVCDTCGEIIEKVGDGWVEWLSPAKGEEKGRGKGLRLVHHKPASPRNPSGSCQYDMHTEFKKDFLLKDMPLSHFLGANGLMVLLSLLPEGELPKEDVLEMIKRLHIPGYEHARLCFDEAIHEGVFEPNTLPGYYWQSDIQATLEYVKRRQGEE